MFVCTQVPSRSGGRASRFPGCPRGLVPNVLGLLVAAIACFPAPLAAAPDPAVDADFAVQGEYAGFVEQAPGCCLWTGLQVVALGGGKFEAVEYPGGLPGNGGTMEQRRKLAGSKTDDTLTLTAEGRRIVLTKGKGRVYDGTGRDLGQLAKYYRVSQTLKAPPPPGAKVLFNGTGTSSFTNGSMTSDRLLNVGADTKDAYGDFTLHLEFRTPYMPEARGQGRGNSGVYIQGRYEVQILDSFGLDGKDNECGGLYKQHPPIVNMCLPPLSWQTYDIDFTAPRFDASGNKTAPARITVRHNGIVVQKDYALTAKTGGGAPEGPDPRPLKLQNHKNPVHFRNIWLVDGKAGVRPCPSYESGNCCTDIVSRWPAPAPGWPAHFYSGPSW